MKIIGIIPARYRSTRLPGKPLINIYGKPIIQRVYENASKSKLLNQVIVATDDKRIFDCVKRFCGDVMRTSTKHKSGTDRTAEAIRNLNCDIVVNIQGDEPLIDAANIDKAIRPLLKDKKIQVSTLAIKIHGDCNDSNTVKVVFDKHYNALYFSRAPIPYYRDKDSKNKACYKHIGLYVYRKKFLTEFARMKPTALETAEKLEQLRILEAGEKIRVVITKTDSVSVDTIDDLKKVEKRIIKC